MDYNEIRKGLTKPESVELGKVFCSLFGDSVKDNQTMDKRVEQRSIAKHVLQTLQYDVQKNNMELKIKEYDSNVK